MTRRGAGTRALDRGRAVDDKRRQFERVGAGAQRGQYGAAVECRALAALAQLTLVSVVRVPST